MIGIVLWETINAGWIHQLNTDGSAGHDFENQIVKRTHTAISKISGLKALPPRTTLSLPTVSGLQHQIDVVVRDGASIYHLIECKFKKSFDIEEIYALNAKLLDYTFGAMKYGHNHVFKGYLLGATICIMVSCARKLITFLMLVMCNNLRYIFD
jgi:hypothetical protein